MQILRLDDFFFPVSFIFGMQSTSMLFWGIFSKIADHDFFHFSKALILLGVRGSKYQQTHFLTETDHMYYMFFRSDLKFSRNRQSTPPPWLSIFFDPTQGFSNTKNFQIKFWQFIRCKFSEVYMKLVWHQNF